MQRPTAFTLIELLVVISIIGLLITILLPVLGSARDSAKLTKELSASKMLLVANRIYIDENKGNLFPTELLNPPFRVENDHGDAIYDPNTGEISAGAQVGYSWRLAPYFDYQVADALLVNEQARVLDQYDALNPVMYNYITSTAPSLGMNFYMGREQHPLLNPFGDLIREAQVRQASNMLVAASARSPNFADYPDGHRYVAQPVSGFLKPLNDAAKFGFIDLRWNHRAVVAFLDGHSQTMDEQAMVDADGMWNGAK